MRKASRDDDPRYEFFRPFYDSRRGGIYEIAIVRDNTRDGLPTTMIARQFPLPEYEGIRVALGVPAQLPDNMILIGPTRQLVPSDGHPISGETPPRGGEDKLTARLREFHERPCFQLTGDRDRRIVINSVNRTTFTPRVDRTKGISEDYAVIRRVFRGSENTILLEGAHALGTLGAAKVVTDRFCLDLISKAVQEIDEFDESRLLEILVRATLDDGRAGALAVDAVHAEPLSVVYDRQWICDLRNGRRWLDQWPWDVHVEARGQEAMRVVGPGESSKVVPRVEIEADLRGVPSPLAKSCRRLLGKPSSNGTPGTRPAADIDGLFDDVLAEPRLRIFLVERPPFGVGERRTELPLGRSEIRLIRKRLVLLLAFGRLLGCGLEVRAATIRRYFPEFRPAASGDELERKFISDVRGKLRDGLEPLLGDQAKPRDYVSFRYERSERRYHLELNRCALVVRLRV